MPKNNSHFVQFNLTRASLHHPEKYIGKVDKICIRSSWEKSFVSYLDDNPGILQWSSEDVVIMYKCDVDKRKHRYFVDFYLKYKIYDGTIKEALVEIKPEAETQRPKITDGMSQKSKNYAVMTYIKNQNKWDAAKEFVKKRGWSFHVLTEKNLNFYGIKKKNNRKKID
jgi:hypothetical protein